MSHDAYQHKFNHEGHLFDNDLFYENHLNMATVQLYSPLIGWLCDGSDLKQVRHRPLLPSTLSYYGKGPVKNTIFLISVVGKFANFVFLSFFTGTIWSRIQKLRNLD